MPVDFESATQVRIALIRHGPSAHAHPGWIDSAGFREWRESYEAAGIRESEPAPAHLQRLMAGAAAVLTSDAPRAVQSAALLAPDRQVIVSPLLRELELLAPRLGPLSLPLPLWALAVGARSLMLTLRSRYPAPAEMARVEHAAAWLGQLAATTGPLAVVTHASFRSLLTKRLIQGGWQLERTRRSLGHWSVWSVSTGRCR